MSCTSSRDLPLDGFDLTDRVGVYRELYNTIRPHEGIDFARPHDRYTAPRTTPPTRQPVRILDAGHCGTPQRLGLHPAEAAVVGGSVADVQWAD
ncbi:MAG: hypothetical protein MSC31_18925 [Solirubrobacteraceae bacterium MAG38_C4-C5]|nr:hypothetical protein [Candidatus Siliceabacter maunaloa]